jgi:hypothetical protein
MRPLAALAARILAGAGGVGILLIAAWGVLWILLGGAISAQAPDPFVADGDPCCGHPDTWGEVAAGVAWTLGLVVVDALLVCVAITLLTWAVARRRPSLKRLALLPAGALLAAVVVFAIVIVPLLDEAVTAPDCHTFAFSRTAWRSGPAHERETQAHAVARCEVVDGRTPRQVRQHLGTPASRGATHDGRSSWDYGDLVVYFAGGRVDDARAGAS